MRFDGQMSAKRRQETIQRFSVPLADSVDSTATLGNAEDTVPVGRQHRASKKVALHADLVDADDNADADFTMAMDDGDDDDDFLDDDADDSAFSGKARQKGKGKTKAKARGRPKKHDNSDDDSLADVNPRVMLISLKAGALGLNLTVANNVYL